MDHAMAVTRPAGIGINKMTDHHGFMIRYLPGELGRPTVQGQSQALVSSDLIDDFQTAYRSIAVLLTILLEVRVCSKVSGALDTPLLLAQTFVVQYCVTVSLSRHWVET